ncbi:MAG: hypothetical protein KF708_24860, partial [Pirellulales bacterium]|nr:hypothetical protein [Pirellulales bacterium]
HRRGGDFAKPMRYAPDLGGAFGGAARNTPPPKASTTPIAPVTAYDVGFYNTLLQRSTVGDNLDIHHVGQSHPLSLVIPGYDSYTAPAIVLPNTEHVTIPNLRGNTDLTARDILARDIKNLRDKTNAPNSALQQLIQLNKWLYPQDFSK